MGATPDFIATTLKVSKQFVYRCLKSIKEESKNDNNRKLTVSNYIKAVEQGYDTKEDLAKYFRIRKETLSRFEKESGILQLLAKYYYIQGESLSAIGQILHMRIGSIQISPDFPTLDKVRHDLNTILGIYGKMAEYGDAKTVRYNEMKKLLGKL